MDIAVPKITYSERSPLPISEYFGRRPWFQIAPILIFLTIFFGAPVSGILWLSFWDRSGELTIENFTRLFTAGSYSRVMVQTLNIASWSTALCLLGAYPVAYYLTKTRASIKGVLFAAILVPMWTSFLVRNLALIIVLGRQGVLNRTGIDIGILDAPIPYLYNFVGVMIGMCNSLMPLCIMTMYSVMHGLDNSYTRAASTLGARPAHAFWRVYFPLSLPGVAAAGLLTFISALGFFVTPQLLGGPKQMMIAQLIIQQVEEVMDWPFAAAIAVLMVAATAVTFFLFDKIVGLQIITGDDNHHSTSRFSQATRIGGMKLINGMSWICAWIGTWLEKIGIKRKGDADPDKAFRPILGSFAMLLGAFLALPIIFLFPISFTEAPSLGWPRVGFTLKWYEEILTSPVWTGAAVRSIIVALVTATLAVAIAIPSALFLSRQVFWAKSLVIMVIMVPIFLPHIITALALFYAYSNFNLIGTYTGLVIGHLIFSLPYATISLMAVLKNYNRTLDYAAWTLGADRFKTFRHVTLPLIKPGLIAAFLLAFIQSFEEVTVSLLVTGGRFSSLPKQLYQEALFRTTPALAAVSTLLFLAVCAIMLVVHLAAKRSRTSAKP